MHHQNLLDLYESGAISRAGEQNASQIADLRARVEGQYVAWRDDVYYYLLTLGLTAAQAQDATQEVFVRLYTAVREGQEIRNPRGWVFRVAHNYGLKQRERERGMAPLDAESWHAADANPEQLAIESQRHKALRQALQDLSPQQRQCLHLRAEGLRYHEIAAVLNVSGSTVNEFLRRAIRKLKRVIHA